MAQTLCCPKNPSVEMFMFNFWHRSFTFNSNKSPTWCNNFSVYYPDVCLHLNMFRAFSCPSSGAQWLQWRCEGKTRGCHCSHWAPMGGKTPETCWAVNKSQYNKLKNCFIRFVIYLNCTMMHGLTSLKLYIQILAHAVRKMWIIQDQKKLALWNKRHFEEKNGECATCLKYSVLIFVEKIYKMQHLEGSGTPVLYIGRTVLKG